jgi:phage terminase large subunit
VTGAISIEYVDKLHPVFTKSKRIKIVIGGRGSTKSTGVADYVACKMMQGELWCCAREQLNSIEESVHRTILDEIERLGLPGFSDKKTGINHLSGGRNFYRGLARNITSLKSTLSGVDGLWIEEGEDISASTLRVLTASVRLNAKDTQRAIAGESVKMPEIIITMNRGSRSDAMSQKFLARAEKELERCGYYEDDLIMVVEMNYTDMPEEWFLLSGLEQERLDDYNNLERAEYDHKWLGKYLDTVPDAIIKPEWFDACVDAHIKLGFKPLGQERIAYDPADTGDAKAVARAHGVVILEAESNNTGLIDTATDWATDWALERRPDAFTWDADGMGMGLKRQISTALEGKKIEVEAFRGSEGADHPDKVYDRVEEEVKNAKTNEETFLNKRAQYYWMLRDRMKRTFQAVTQGKMFSPEQLISFSSGIKELTGLRTELCQIPRKYNNSGRIQLLSKQEMKKMGIPSPNLADAVMMCTRPIEVKRVRKELKQSTRWIV